MKPIEEGCMAVIVGTKQKEGNRNNVGKIVNVGKFIGYIPGFREDLWEVDIPILFTSGEEHMFCPEWGLERIDDEDTTEDSEMDKELETK